MGLLELLIVLVVIAWLLGTFVAPVGWVNLLIAVIVVLVAIRLIQGRGL